MKRLLLAISIVVLVSGCKNNNNVPEHSVETPGDPVKILNQVEEQSGLDYFYESRNTEITLRVKADSLFLSNHNTDTAYILKQCFLFDNKGNGATGSDIPTMISPVHKNGNVKWSAQVDDASSLSGYVVEINQIQKKSNSPTDIFSKRRLPSKKGKVNARVKNEEMGPSGKIYDYLISFTIIDNDGYEMSFTIDPKLKANN